MSDPFAPIQPSPSAAPPVGTVPCAVCGTPIDPNAASYSERGQLVCKRCEAKETIEVGEQRAASGIVAGAMSAFSLGMLSMCVNPLLLTSIGAIGSGIGVFVTLARHPEYKAKLGGRYPFVVGGTVVGMLLGLVGPCLGVLAQAGLVMLRELH